jgi:hypothetical protein
MLTKINDLLMSVYLTLTGARPVTARRGAGMLEYALLGLIALSLFFLIQALATDSGPVAGLIDRISDASG